MFLFKHSPENGFDYSQAVSDAWAESPFHFGLIVWIFASIVVALLILAAWLAKTTVGGAEWFILPVVVLFVGALIAFPANGAGQKQEIHRSVRTDMQTWAQERYGVKMDADSLNDLRPAKAGAKPTHYILAEPGQYITVVRTMSGLKLLSATPEQMDNSQAGDELPFVSDESVTTLAEREAAPSEVA